MAKWWSLLFGVVILASTLLFVISPFVPGWWLPGGHSTHAAGIDLLFYLILAVTGFFFILTEGLLVVFIWAFGSSSGSAPSGIAATPPGKSFADTLSRPFKKFIPNENRLELIWTAIPAVILLLLAVGQIPSWMDIKFVSHMPPDEKGPKMPLHVVVSARQFEWRFRYPSPATWAEWKKKPELAKNWATTPEFDDVHVVNELHVWTNEQAQSTEEVPPFVCHLSTLDVQHNLNIPHFRIKQDALPGKVIPVWCRPTKVNTVKNAAKNRWEDGGGWDEYDQPRDKQLVWEIACAELCGRWHYHMIARVYVHPSEADFLAWLEQTAAKQDAKKRDAGTASTK